MPDHQGRYPIGRHLWLPPRRISIVSGASCHARAFSCATAGRAIRVPTQEKDIVHSTISTSGTQYTFTVTSSRRLVVEGVDANQVVETSELVGLARARVPRVLAGDGFQAVVRASVPAIKAALEGASPQGHL